jgi:DNA-binding MarR family transcriptional regulator
MHGELQKLGRAVKQVQYRHHRALESALSTVGTTLAQWDALRAISRSPGASARALAAATFQTEQAFGTLAGRLVAQGLVERRPGHGRRIEHHLTPDGEQVLAAGHKITDEVLATCFAPLSTADRGVLLDLLQQLINDSDISESVVR